jgi:hypothetical protein
MSFSDDHASPAAPFSGDNTGDIFNAPDVVLNSPMTIERVVDTQSGFLVVVRKLDERHALMVRRRLGTPPSSSIVLTPDESLKLSRILAGGSAAAVEQRSLTPSGDGWLEEFNDIAYRRGAARLAEELSPSRPSVGSVKPDIWQLALIGVGLSLLALAGLMGYSLASAKPSAVKKVAVAAKPADPLESKKVDAFARQFVAEMLDFNPETYRVSQIRAMAAMSPLLVDTYWQDTNFPLSKRQLASLPHETNLMIMKVNQERPAANEAIVDVFAQMVQGDSKIGTPVHLRLKLAVDNGDIRVLEQNDVSEGK